VGAFLGFFSPERTTQKKRKKEEEKMAEVPTFKLVLVGDGGTGASFSFLRLRREEERCDLLVLRFSFFFFLSLKALLKSPSGEIFFKRGRSIGRKILRGRSIAFSFVFFFPRRRRSTIAAVLR